MRTQIKHHFKAFLVLAAISVVAISSLNPMFVQAAQITGRKITLSSSAGDATGVTYTLTTAALPTTGTAIKSLKVEFCTTAVGACTTPTGFVTSSSTLSSQPSGVGAASGWTVSTADANELRIVNAANATNPSGAVTVTWGAVENPTNNNETFYGRITTYSGTDWSTGPLDTGTVGVSTAAQITVSATVDETLSFCTGTSITGTDCGTATGQSVSLGALSPTATASGTSLMVASTNAGSGYAITYNGATLTSSGNTIDVMSTTSTTGTEQFGLNLVDNATPNVGTAASGATSGVTYDTGYGTADTFTFVAGSAQQIVSKAAASNATKYTVAYIANIASTTEPGSYSTTLTYTATATF